MMMNALNNAPDGLELVDTIYSGNAWKVRLLCGYLGLPLRRRTLSIVDGDLESDDFVEINPLRQVPVLRTHEGAWLAESAAILWYLGEGSRFVPVSALERAQVVHWLSFEQALHMPFFAQPRLKVVLRQTALVSDPEVVAWRVQGEKALRVLEAHFRQRSFLVGEQPTIADVALFPYTYMAEMGGYSLQPYPHIRQWLDHMVALDGFQSLLAAAPNLATHKEAENG
ncbi:glutathione S-transferase family protein [Cupriavidus sp. 2KB_15]|uniref:glutathione S-transferase family protein n=1 Tax=Cupriavidus sp. 2KB_15 TaxID=3232976 RepID=UPI003F918E5C